MTWLRKSHFHYVVAAPMLAMLVACGAGAPEFIEEKPIPEWKRGIDIPDNRYVDHYRILLLGNSHVYVNDLGWVRSSLFVCHKGAS